MAKPPIEIGIASDGEAFRKGIKADVIAPLEDAEKALDDLGKSKGPDRLERELEVAQERTEDLRKETKRTAEAIDDEYRRSTNRAKDSFKGASDAAQEFTNETKQNLSEVVSSFDGDLSSIQDLAQGTLGGLASSLPGALGVAGAAGAVAVGLIGTAIEGLAGNAERMNERVTEQFRDMAQNGIDEWASAQSVIDRMTDAYSEHSADIKRISEELGIPAEVVVQAWAGVPDAIDLVNAKIDEARANVEKLANGNGEVANQLYLNLEAATAPLRDAIEITRQAEEKYREFAAWQDSYLRDVIEQAGTAQLEVDELGNQLYTLPDGQKVLIEVDTNRATTNIDSFKEDLDGIPETVSTRAEIQTPDVGNVWNIMQNRLRGLGPLRINVEANLPGVRVL